MFNYSPFEVSRPSPCSVASRLKEAISTAIATPGVLCLVWTPPEDKRDMDIVESPVKGREDDAGTGKFSHMREG